MDATLKFDGIEVHGPVPDEFAEILTPDALEFAGVLAREFEPRRKALLERRKEVQAEIDRGKFPDFLPQTRKIRESEMIH